VQRHKLGRGIRPLQHLCQCWHHHHRHHNIGTPSCRLAGYPPLLRVRAGSEYDFTHREHGTQDSDLTPTSLTPLESGGLILDYANVCPLSVADQFTGLVIVLPGHEGRVGVFDVLLSDPRGLGESQLGWARGFAFD
jgi:hypothetical protein